MDRLLSGVKVDGNTSQEIIRVKIEIQEGREEMEELDKELGGSPERQD